MDIVKGVAVLIMALFSGSGPFSQAHVGCHLVVTAGLPCRSVTQKATPLRGEPLSPISPLFLRPMRAQPKRTEHTRSAAYMADVKVLFDVGKGSSLHISVEMRGKT